MQVTVNRIVIHRQIGGTEREVTALKTRETKCAVQNHDDPGAMDNPPRPYPNKTSPFNRPCSADTAWFGLRGTRDQLCLPMWRGFGTTRGTDDFKCCTISNRFYILTLHHNLQFPWLAPSPLSPYSQWSPLRPLHPKFLPPQRQ